MNSLDEFYSQSTSFSQFSEKYFQYIHELSKSVSRSSLDEAMGLLLTTARNDGTIYCLGNGGSSSTAEHFANDMSMCPENSLWSFKAISLTSNNSLYSAIANDHGFENVFTYQLKKYLKPHDLLVAFSASGNSKNIINAINYANKIGCSSIGISGFDGGLLKQMTKVSIHVPSKFGEYGPVEDLHLMFNHMIGTYLKNLIKNETKNITHTWS